MEQMACWKWRGVMSVLVVVVLPGMVRASEFDKCTLAQLAKEQAMLDGYGFTKNNIDKCVITDITVETCKVPECEKIYTTQIVREHEECLVEYDGVWTTPEKYWNGVRSKAESVCNYCDGNQLAEVAYLLEKEAKVVGIDDVQAYAKCAPRILNVQDNPDVCTDNTCAPMFGSKFYNSLPTCNVPGAMQTMGALYKRSLSVALSECKDSSSASIVTIRGPLFIFVLTLTSLIATVTSI